MKTQEVNVYIGYIDECTRRRLNSERPPITQNDLRYLQVIDGILHSVKQPFSIPVFVWHKSGDGKRDLSLIVQEAAGLGEVVESRIVLVRPAELSVAHQQNHFNPEIRPEAQVNSIDYYLRDGLIEYGFEHHAGYDVTSPNWPVRTAAVRPQPPHAMPGLPERPMSPRIGRFPSC